MGFFKPKKIVSGLLSVCISATALMGISSGVAHADTGMSDNLFKNGSFEAPIYTLGQKITNTEVTSDGLYDGADVTVVETGVTQGSQALEIPAGKAVRQEVTGLTVGETYIFSADLKNVAENTSFFLLSLYAVKEGVSNYETSFNTGHFNGEKKAIFEITAKSDTYRLKIENVQGDTLYLDNARLTELKAGVVYDGSFEDALTGTYDVGMNRGFGFSGPAGTVVTTKAYSGSKSFKVADTATNGVYRAKMAVEPNAEYEFSAYVFLEEGANASIGKEQYLREEGQSSSAYANLGTVGITGDGKWHKIAISVTTNGASDLLHYKLTMKGVSYIDDIRLRKVVRTPGVFRNGSFEEPEYEAGTYNTSDVSLYAVRTRTCTAEIATDNFSDGSQSLKMSDIIAGESAFDQEVTLEQRKSYVLSMDVYIPNGSAGYFECSIYNEDRSSTVYYGNSGEIETGSWKTISYNFLVKEGYDARIKILPQIRGEKTVYVDNIVLTEETITPGVFLNGDFESYNTGDYTNKNYNFKKVALGAQAVAAVTERPNGNMALMVTATEQGLKDDTASINQYIKLEEEKIYKISMKVSVDSTEEANAIKLCVLALKDAEHSENDWFVNNWYTETVDTSSFVTVSKTFKAPRDCDAQVKISPVNVGDVYLDDITLEEVTVDEVDFEFEHGTPSQLQVGNEYTARFPEGELIVAQYDEQGRLVTVGCGTVGVSVTPVQGVKEVKFFALDSFSTLKPLTGFVRFDVE